MQCYPEGKNHSSSPAPGTPFLLLEGEAAVEFASRRWRCLRTVGGRGKSGRGGGEQSVTRGDGKADREEERGRGRDGGLSSDSGHCSGGSRSMN